MLFINRNLKRLFPQILHLIYVYIKHFTKSGSSVVVPCLPDFGVRASVTFHLMGIFISFKFGLGCLVATF